MVNMMLGNEINHLSLNDLLGLCDLYHKYDGDFFDLDNMERCIIGKIMQDTNKNKECKKYMGFITMLVNVYNMQRLYVYLMRNNLC
jgi:hypothetical protein